MKDYVKDNENPMVENRDLSTKDEYVSKDVFRVDTVVVDEVAQTAESESTQENLDVTDVSGNVVIHFNCMIDCHCFKINCRFNCDIDVGAMNEHQ